MNKAIVLHVCLLLLGAGLLIPIYSQTLTTNLPSKAIHVVYDDSRSMFFNFDQSKPEYLDRWGQAKYAMEVFAAMLQENDTMCVYYMSDYVLNHPAFRGNTEAPPKITIKGTDSADARVREIHNTVTYGWGTPFAPVAKAYKDLKNADADVKWLVVLTDGEFDGGPDVNAFFSQYVMESEVKIILLAIGDDAEVIRADPGRDIYFEHARNSNEILGKITTICNRIFNRNSVRFTNETRHEFPLDVPLLELLVFAQGPDVSVDSISGAVKYNPSEPPVNVRYSEVASTEPDYRNNPNVIKSEQLTGVMAVFRDIPKGRYSIDVTGAQTIEVFHKPAVSVGIKLHYWYDFFGLRAISLKETPEGTYEIPEGRYRIKYSLIDDSGKFVKNSSLIRDVEYEAALQNGGETIPVKKDSIIKIRQGELAIPVRATFLDFNTAENSLIGNVNLRTFFDCLMQYWPIIFALLLLLWWLSYYPLKKKFPKMAKKPKIRKECDGEEYPGDWGKFTIIRKTKWLPLVAQRGRIRVIPRDKVLPQLKVKAKNNDEMVLTNADVFTQEKLKDKRFYINHSPLRKGIGRKMEISCHSTIQTIYPGNDGSPEEKYTCFL